MVRNVKREKGFSFVEILVSMVILAIVVLVMTNVLVTSTKSHSGAVSEDVGDMLALQKLAELQNHVIPAKDGVDPNVEKDGTKYKILWEVEKPTATSTTPPQAKVTVTWIATNGLEDTAQIVGYIDSDNACPDNGGGAPTGIKFIWGVDAAGDPKVYAGIRTLTPPLPAHTPIVYLVGEDVELAAGNDRVTIELTDDLSNKYYLRNDTLRNRVLIPAPIEDDLKFQITDCGNQSAPSEIPFTVKIDGSAIPVIGPVNLGSVAENDPNEKVFALTSTGGNGNITWSLSGAPDAISVKPVLPTPSSDGKLIIAADGVNYEEVNGKARFTLIATDIDGQSGEALCSLIVTDENDAPTGITLSNNVVSSSPDIGDIVGVLAAVDEDVLTANRVYTYSVQTPGSKFTTDGNKLKVAHASLNQPSYDVMVRVLNGATQKDTTFTILVSGSVNLCDSKPWNHGAAPYKDGDYVKYTNAGVTKIYQAIKDVPQAPTGQISPNPETATDYWIEVEICTP